MLYGESNMVLSVVE